MTEKKRKKIDFDLFIELLRPFHPETTKGEKYYYLFKIYDINGVKFSIIIFLIIIIIILYIFINYTILCFFLL